MIKTIRRKNQKDVVAKLNNLLNFNKMSIKNKLHREKIYLYYLII